jgi:hypothetical protein
VRQVQVSPKATVTLDGSGNGQCGMTPPSGTRWDLTLAAVSTTSAAKIPQALLYLGSSNGPLTLVDSTYSGNSASSGKISGAPFFAGTWVWAIWRGGDPGAVATLQCYGMQMTRYRAGLSR